MAQEWSESITDYNSRVLFDKQFAWPPHVTTEDVSQCDLSQSVEEALLANLISDATSKHDLARLRSVSSADAGKWLNAIPSKVFQQAFSSAEFVTIVSWWLGKPLPANQICPGCRKQLTDSQGYHQLTCRWKGSLGVRHNALRDVIAKAMGAAGWTVAKELNIFSIGKERAADILHKTFPPEAYDIACTHGLQPMYLDETAMVGPSAATKYAFSHKDEKYKIRAAKEGVFFIPLVCDVHGNWTSVAHEVFKVIARDIAARINCNPGRQLQFLLQRLSVTTQRCNARALLLRSHRAWDTLEGDSEECPAIASSHAGDSSDVEEDT